MTFFTCCCWSTIIRKGRIYEMYVRDIRESLLWYLQPTIAHLWKCQFLRPPSYGCSLRAQTSGCQRCEISYQQYDQTEWRVAGYQRYECENDLCSCFLNQCPDDLCGRLPVWPMTYVVAGLCSLWPVTYVVNDLCGQEPMWSMTYVVNDLCGQWPMWSMTYMVNDLCGQWPVLSMTCLGQRLPRSWW